MARLTIADVHNRQLLTNVGLRWKNPAYIANECCPIVPVKNESDYYVSWPKSVWFRDEAQIVNPGGRAPTIGLNVTLTNRYDCQEYKIASLIPKRIAANADSQLGLRARYAELLADKILLARERRTATLFQTTANWTATVALSGVTQWSDYDNSDPVTNIDTGITAVHSQTCGLKANTFITDYTTWTKLKRHPEIRALCFGGGDTGPALVTPALFGKAFEFERVLIGQSYYNANEEDTDESGITYTGIWTDTTWIGHVTPAASMTTPSAAYTFRSGYKVRSWYQDAEDTDYMEVGECCDEVAVAADCGYTISDCVA